ncbi:hypothetical protein ACNKHR_17850 [Shigella flexneri]
MEGTTIPAYDGWSTTGYIPAKSPTFYGKTVEVVSLAKMLVKLAAGRRIYPEQTDEIVAIYQKRTGNTLEAGTAALHAGRMIGRTVHGLRIAGYPAKPIQCTDHQYRQRRLHHLCETEHSGNG